jgi:hypothetical protein
MSTAHVDLDDMTMLTIVLEDDRKHSPDSQRRRYFFLNNTRPVHRDRTDDQLEPVDPATSNALGEARLCPSHADPGSNFVDAGARAGQ